MGVDRSDYILLGYDISEMFEEFEEDRVDELYYRYYPREVKSGDIILLDDGMSRNYTYFGVILQADKDGYNGLEPFVFDDDFPIERDKVERAVWEEFSIDDEAKLIVLTHWH